ncbi:hypothetical protein CASFOL_021093 [Castilleja foliolosa]|uniref:Coiled-coil domain-containing protein 167 n=1 Tax=Castilleja foliolosa TaxID=1961234 RepID=A0ABD3CY77_9LAMI
MCPRSKQIILGLLAKINKLEAEMNESIMKERKLEAEIRMLRDKMATMNQKHTFKTIVILVTICVTLVYMCI